MHKVSPNVRVVKVVLEQRWDLATGTVESVTPGKGLCKCTHLDGAHIDRTINEVVPNVHLRMLNEDLAWDVGVLLGRIASDGLVMQAL